MDFLFNYESAKETVVFFAYFLILWFDVYMIGYVLLHSVKWIYKKIKEFRRQKKLIQPRQTTKNN